MRDAVISASRRICAASTLSNDQIHVGRDARPHDDLLRRPLSAVSVIRPDLRRIVSRPPKERRLTRKLDRKRHRSPACTDVLIQANPRIPHRRIVNKRVLDRNTTRRRQESLGASYATCHRLNPKERRLRKARDWGGEGDSNPPPSRSTSGRLTIRLPPPR